jgi:hypothetical protein
MKTKSPETKSHAVAYAVGVAVLLAVVGSGVYYKDAVIGLLDNSTTIEAVKERIEYVEKEMTWEEQLRIATEKKNAEVAELEAEKVRIAEERAARLADIKAEYEAYKAKQEASYDAQTAEVEGRLEDIRETELSL